MLLHFKPYSRFSYMSNSGLMIIGHLHQEFAVIDGIHKLIYLPTLWIAWALQLPTLLSISLGREMSVPHTYRFGIPYCFPWLIYIYFFFLDTSCTEKNFIRNSYFTKVWLIYSIVLVSAVRQSDSVIYTKTQMYVHSFSYSFPL